MDIKQVAGDIFLWINAIGGLAVGITNLVHYFSKNKRNKRWVKALYSLFGFWWTIAYSILAFVPLEGDKIVFTSLAIRPSISILIVLILIDSLANLEPIYLPDLMTRKWKKLKMKWRKHAEY